MSSNKRAFADFDDDDQVSHRSSHPSAPPTPSPPPQEHTPKRQKNTPFNPIAIAKQGYTFTLAELLAKLRDKKGRQPWTFGVAIGMMLFYIPRLISEHLVNPVEHQSSVPEALSWATGFTEAVDAYIAYLRLTDGCSEKYPSQSGNGKSARKYFERYVWLVEAAYENCVREELADVFNGYSKEDTALFNKGIDKTLSGVQWMVYPTANVVFEVGEGDWGVWICGKCEELGMAEARAGRKVLEGV